MFRRKSILPQVDITFYYVLPAEIILRRISGLVVLRIDLAIEKKNSKCLTAQVSVARFQSKKESERYAGFLPEFGGVIIVTVNRYGSGRLKNQGNPLHPTNRGQKF
jgi:hypothetical protein